MSREPSHRQHSNDRPNIQPSSNHDKDVRDRRVDVPHLLAEATNDEGEGNLEHNRETFEEEIECLIRVGIKLAMAVQVALPEYRHAHLGRCGNGTCAKENQRGERPVWKSVLGR